MGLESKGLHIDTAEQQKLECLSVFSMHTQGMMW